MDFIFLATILLVLIFSFVILFGAPYLPTLRRTTKDAFELLNLKPGQMLIELGSGDGRVLRYAAQKGIKGIGYELNPLLVWYSQLRNWRYRKLISFKCRNYWQVALPQCDGIYVFLLDKYMSKLDKKITQELAPPIVVVSYAFKIPGKKIVKEKNGLFLYQYK
jgi:hypothetical protein